MSADASSTNTTTPDQWTIRRILEWTTEFLTKNGSESPRLDTEILLSHACDCERIELYTNYNRVLTDEERTRMRDLVQRRAKAEPVAYLVGFREFYSLNFKVNSAVLIPRPDTETLVMEALEIMKPLELPRVLDMGTGSGCIAISLAVNHRQSQVTATDVSEAALSVAQENATTHQVADRMSFHAGDLFSALTESPREQFDVIVSNPPYVTSGEMDQLPPDIRLHEPHLALHGGGDGLQLLQRIIDEAPAWLKPTGCLLMELSPEQAGTVAGLVEENSNFQRVQVLKDLAGRDRVVCGYR